MDPLQKKICLAIVNIFESGSVNGSYGAVTVLKGDSGHLTYGRSQTTLGSGNLYPLLSGYCAAPDATHAGDLQPYLNRVASKDFTLDSDGVFKGILRDAGHDPAMQNEQDAFFDRAFYNPSVAAAQALGLHQPLSQAVVYDSHIQGGWTRISRLVNNALGPPGTSVDERAWIAKYVETRADFLKAGAKPLPTTVYRMDAFRILIADGKWDLPLALTVHGVAITNLCFQQSPAMPVLRVAVPDPEIDSQPILRPALPYAKGAPVLALQQMLDASGMTNSQDGIYGPFAQVLVKQFQGKHGLKADAVVGPQTWALLAAGLPERGAPAGV